MKFKFFAILLLGSALVSNAQGYKDGIEYFKVGKIDNAKELLDKNLNDPKTVKAEAYCYLGHIEAAKGNKAGAKEYYNKGVAADAQNPFNYIALGALDLKAGDAKAAEEQFKMAQKVDKKSASVYAAIARAYYEADPVAYAKELGKNIEKARKTDKQDPDVYILEGDMKAAEKDYGGAAGQYELAFTFDPTNEEAYVKYANTYFHVNPQMATAKLEELLVKTPNSALAQRELAEKYYELDLGSQAAEQYGKYIQNPNHFKQDEIRYAQLLFFGGKYDQSFELAKSIRSATPAGDKDHFFMCRMQLYNKVALEQWAEAETYGAELFAMNIPGMQYTSKDFVDYATALKNVGKTAESVAQYEKAVEYNPNNIDLIRDLVDVYEQNENYVKAAEYYQKIVDSPECKANDLYLMSTKYFNVAATTQDDEALKQKSLEGARKYAALANEKVPGNYRIVQQQAKIENLAGNKPEAVKYYNETLAILDAKENSKVDYKEVYIGIYANLARMAFESDDKVGARDIYMKWLEVDPENAALRDYVEKMKV
ncbi:MAG: tetratricopeptide repeat protein, partial [Muribaculaceae bacterium]